jgi:hypothetical protein
VSKTHVSKTDVGIFWQESFERISTKFELAFPLKSPKNFHDRATVTGLAFGGFHM